MDNDVQVGFETLSDDVFAKLMDDAPPSSAPSAANLPGASKPEPKTEPAPAEPPKPAATPAAAEPPKEPEKTPEELAAEIEGASDNPEEKTQAPEGVDEQAFFKAKAMGLIERGIWQEFEGMEDFEWNEENYGRLVEAQAQWKADEKYEDVVSKVGDIGKVILDHIQNGGNPDDIIDLFKASKRLENLDIKTASGQENLVREYYSKVVGWSEAKTDKYVKSLVDAGDARLLEEATEAKELMDKGIQEQIKQTQEAQKQAKAQQEAQARAWESNITKTIKEREDLNDQDKRELQDSLLNYNQKLPDGRVVSKFMVKFMEMQADPQKYIELVRFVTNPDKYKAKTEKKAETTAAKKAWEFIKGNQGLSKSTGTSHSKLQDKPKNDLVVDYKKIMQQQS